MLILFGSSGKKRQALQQGLAVVQRYLLQSCPVILEVQIEHGKHVRYSGPGEYTQRKRYKHHIDYYI